jgi:hypothetical protein
MSQKISAEETKSMGMSVFMSSLRAEKFAKKGAPQEKITDR